MVFAIVTPTENAGMASEIERLFPDEHIRVWPGVWFVNSPTTSTPKEISDALGITGGKNGLGLVMPVFLYFGRANSDVWEWLAVKRQSTSSPIPGGPTVVGTATK